MRGFSTVGIAMGSALFGALLAAPLAASASNGDPVIAGQDNSATNVTRLLRPSDPAGEGVGHTLEVARGLAADYADFNVTGRPAIQALSHSGNETVMVANLGAGQYGGGPGLTVQNQKSSLPALIAKGSVRGGQFIGDAAQVQLLPGRTAHPTTGSPGDIYLDKNMNLWLCKGGTKWKQIA